MSTGPIPAVTHNALVLSATARRHSFCERKRSAQQVNFEVKQILKAQDNPATREQGTDLPGRAV